jgi:endonuclease G, mitochondrial
MNTSRILTDSDLAKEIRLRIQSGAYAPGFPITDRQKSLEIFDRFVSGERPDFAIELEAIVLTVGRPAILIKNGTFNTPDSEVWRTRLETSRPQIEKAISAVGRIEVKNHPGFDWIGTGWVVGDDVVATNRHVAEEFAVKGNASGFRFRRNYENREMAARLDLREEYMQPEEAEFRVTRVLHIEDSDGPDVAFLEVEFSGNNRPSPIKLASGTSAGDYVAVIGYPAWDGRRNDPAVMRQVFGDIYDVKRLQPGQIISAEAHYVAHDCATLGGNSGSPVIDLLTGEAVGLHFSGKYLQANSAVPASIVKDRLNQI